MDIFVMRLPKQETLFAAIDSDQHFMKKYKTRCFIMAVLTVSIQIIWLII